MSKIILFGLMLILVACGGKNGESCCDSLAKVSTITTSGEINTSHSEIAIPVYQTIIPARPQPIAGGTDPDDEPKDRVRILDFDTGKALGGNTHCYPVFYVDCWSECTNINVYAYRMDSDGEEHNRSNRVEVEDLSPYLHLVTIPLGCKCLTDINITVVFENEGNSTKYAHIDVK